MINIHKNQKKKLLSFHLFFVFEEKNHGTMSFYDPLYHISQYYGIHSTQTERISVFIFFRKFFVLINRKSIILWDYSRLKINLSSLVLIHLCHLTNFYMHPDDNFFNKSNACKISSKIGLFLINMSK